MALDDGLTFAGYPQPPTVPPDPTGDDWRGEPGPQGPPGEDGVPGPQGPSGEASGAVIATGSTELRTLADRFADVANVLDWGADPTGADDSTAAFLAAIATGRTVYVPKGNYKITDMVTLGNHQIMYGDSRTASILRVAHDTFNLAALGVVRMAPSETSSTLRDIGICFTQPQTAVRASIVAFPPGIYAQSSGRFTLTRVRVSQGSYGLDARGNTGGSFIDDFEVSALVAGMLWDGALDSVHISWYHFWVFGSGVAADSSLLAGGTDLRSVFNDGVVKAASFGRVDGLAIDGFLSFCGMVEFTAASSASAQMHISTLQLDSNNARLDVTGVVRLQINKLAASQAPGSTFPTIKTNSGRTFIDNCNIAGTVGTTAIQVVGGGLWITGGHLEQDNENQSLAETSGGLLSIIGTSVTGKVATYTVPLIKQSGAGTLIMRSVTFRSGTGVGVEIAADLSGNYLSGIYFGSTWTISLPAAARGANPAGYYDWVHRPLGDITSFQVGNFSFYGLSASFHFDTAIGYAALSSITTGASNTAVGAQAGKALTISSHNTFIGSNAGLSTTGTSNTALGSAALQALTIGITNVAIGASALAVAVDGNANTAVGYEAGKSVTTGGGNTIIGRQVGSTVLATGDQNILIGVDSSVTTPTDISNFFGLGGTGGVTFSATGMNTAVPAWSFLGSVTTSGALTVIGDATFGSNTNTIARVILNAQAGSSRTIRFQTAGVNRWELQTTASDNLLLTAYDNAGASLFSPVTVTRLTGMVAISKGVQISGAASTIDQAVIGSTTAAAGSFTTLSASSTVNGAGFTALVAPYAPLSSPTFTGTPAAPTATAGTNTSQLATTAFVTAAVTAGTAGVASFNTRTGAVTLATGDLTALSAYAGSFTTLAASGAVSGAGFTALFASPPDIGGTVAGAGAFTTISASGQVTSTVSTGTAPLVVASTTNVANLNASSLGGATFAAPGAIGGGTPAAGAFTTLSASSTVSGAGFTTLLSPYAPLASPTFTGTPAAPTASPGTNTTQVATTAFSLANRRNSSKLQAQWVNGAVVTNDTVWMSYDAPYAGTINTLKHVTTSGSFTVAIKINGTNVTSLSAVSVTSTPATATATAANTFSAGDVITAVISAASGSPTGAMLSVDLTWS